MELTVEQKEFIQKAKEGNNILVNACIGSGKTTAIQELCKEIPKEKKILYLTYNKLLKIDAKSKIKQKNVLVTNYHGFAYMALKGVKISVGVSDLIQTYNKRKPPISQYDILILDEYQDINSELSDLLLTIKDTNPNIQIIAVGDMDQKIYDFSKLNISEFINTFLGDYIKMEFTQCFRLPKEYAKDIGALWNKKITGVNKNCKIRIMSNEEIIHFLGTKKPKDILCLGARKGTLSKTLNAVEEKYPQIYNKKTVYASISDNDAEKQISPSSNTAIFTTYDSSKGLERDICIIFDYTEEYWESRAKATNTNSKILKNIFLVAASRGKKEIIFCFDGYTPLSDKTLTTKNEKNKLNNKIPFPIAEMFDFKYKEDVVDCFNTIKTKEIKQNSHEVIEIQSHDELIDLSPCIGAYQEAIYFNKHSINTDIEFYFAMHPSESPSKNYKNWSLEKKILYLTSKETKQDRYIKQVDTPYITQTDSKKICDRLNTNLSKNEEVQIPCSIEFSDENDDVYTIMGRIDVLKDDTIWELKFVNELSKEHFLQLACYLVALNKEKGILWNTKTNEMYEVTIPNKKMFLDKVINTITKGFITKYNEPTSNEQQDKSKAYDDNNVLETNKRFAIIDTETNFNNEIMSIGLIIVNPNSMDILDKTYLIITPEYKIGGIFSDALLYGNQILDEILYSHKTAMQIITEQLKKYQVEDIFAYNASFDYNLLPELQVYKWFDIMKIAAYKQFNNKIPQNVECCKSGRIRKGYGVEPMMHLLTNGDYHETHNALHDAIDELEIMKLIDQPIHTYKANAECNSNKRNVNRSSSSKELKITHKIEKAKTTSRNKPTRKQSPFNEAIKEQKQLEYIGKSNLQKCGEVATIIEYNTYGNIIVQFENGVIKRTRTDAWKDGSVSNKKSNVNTQEIAQINSDIQLKESENYLLLYTSDECSTSQKTNNLQSNSSNLVSTTSNNSRTLHGNSNVLEKNKTNYLSMIAMIICMLITLYFLCKFDILQKILSDLKQIQFEFQSLFGK